MSNRIAVIGVLAALFASSFAVPAFGGTNLASKAFNRAKAALSLARTAKFNAGTAQSTANSALSTANTANGTATAAAAGPRIIKLDREVSVGPGGFQSSTVTCPAGYSVSGSAMSLGAIDPVAEAVGTYFVIFDGYNPSATSTFHYHAYVVCVKSAGATAQPASINANARLDARRARAEFNAQ